jgi:hypothetical protein
MIKVVKYRLIDDFPDTLIMNAVKRYSIAGAWILLAVSLSAADALAENAAIVGKWQCQMTYQGTTAGSGLVSFDNNGQCMMGGQPFSYQLLAGNVLQISNGSASDTYNYRLENGRLKLSYRDGSAFDCVKQSADAPPGGLLQMQGNTRSQSDGNAWQLRGTFCHYSGSSSYGSSYSSTSRISFDGRGHWTMGSESSFSGEAGSAYSGGGVDNSGTYRINGGQVFYTTSNGEQGVARVNMQQSDGRITEIYVGEDLYSPSLCD